MRKPIEQRIKDITMAKQYFDEENQIDYAKFIFLILIVFFLGVNIGDMHAKKHCTCKIPVSEVIHGHT